MRFKVNITNGNGKRLASTTIEHDSLGDFVPELLDGGEDSVRLARMFQRAREAAESAIAWERGGEAA